MIKLLVRLFVKDYKNIEDVEVRTNYGILASVVGVIANLLLFLIKLIIGIFIKSISVIGDAFNNLTDASSSIIGYIGVKIAAKPADSEHPFGHGRAEYIASFIVAVLIIQVGLSVIQNSISKIINPEPVAFNWTTIIFLFITILVKVWLALFNSKLGKRINSNVMKATAADSIGDVVVTSATILSIIAERISGYSIDGWSGLIVGGFVLISGANVAKETLLPLMGESINKNVYKRISNKVESYDGIVGSHDLIVHNYGPSNIMATIHAEVPNDSNLEKIHEKIDLIEREILEDMGIFLVIHMDPVETNDTDVIEKRNIVTKIVKDLDSDASIHDFRVLKGEKKTNLIFDLVVPYSYSSEDERTLIRNIIKEIRKLDFRYDTTINIENSFVSDS